jgi:hypothetical protein
MNPRLSLRAEDTPAESPGGRRLGNPGQKEGKPAGLIEDGIRRIDLNFPKKTENIQLTRSSFHCIYLAVRVMFNIHMDIPIKEEVS